MRVSRSGRFEFLETPIQGLHLLQRKPLGDQRGYFQRMFCSDDLSEIGWHETIAQINHTYTERKGAVRGMHMQLSPNAEMKLISCLQGEVWDVAVDLRAGSPSFLKWHGVLLSPKNQQSLLIPPGFAHGFQTLTDEVEMLYCHSKAYAPASEAGCNPFDPLLEITWPELVTEISDRDKNCTMLNKDYQGVIV